MADNWLSTDAMIAEVCDHMIKMSEGEAVYGIRCPDDVIEKRVRAYLNSKRGGKLVTTYIGDSNEPVKGSPIEGAPTRSKSAAKKGASPPVDQDDDDGEITPEQGRIADEVEEWPRDPFVDEMIGEPPPDLDQIVEDKHNAQMADLTPDDELDGLV